jgi:hypothetical protein
VYSYIAYGLGIRSASQHELKEAKPVKSEREELGEKSQAGQQAKKSYAAPKSFSSKCAVDWCKQQQPQKPYATPKLAVHGNVEKITEFIGGAPRDGLRGSALDMMITDGE